MQIGGPPCENKFLGVIHEFKIKIALERRVSERVWTAAEHPLPRYVGEAVLIPLGVEVARTCQRKEQLPCGSRVRSTMGCDFRCRKRTTLQGFEYAEACSRHNGAGEELSYQGVYERHGR